MCGARTFANGCSLAARSLQVWASSKILFAGANSKLW
jgi:hypothetical protein